MRNLVDIFSIEDGIAKKKKKIGRHKNKSTHIIKTKSKEYPEHVRKNLKLHEQEEMC